MPRAVEISSRPRTEHLTLRPGLASESTCSEAERHLWAALERLRTARTGREAVLNILHEVLAAGVRELAESNAAPPAILNGTVAVDSTQQISREWRHSLRSLLFELLERSVFEGELPEDAETEVLTCLCTSFVSGLAVGLRDGLPTEALAQSISLFVESVGFHKIRPPRRSPGDSQKVLAPVITLVKR